MNKSYCITKPNRTARGGIIFFTCVLFLAYAQVLFAEAKWSLHADAGNAHFLTEGMFEAPEIGFTDVVPPSGLQQSHRALQTEAGYEVTLWGTELSWWQNAAVPASSRYLLEWDFVYEGRIAEGRGRTGFIFGNPASTNLLSVEITYAGSLRLVSWSNSIDGKLGRIVYSRKAAPGGSTAITLEARYNIRDNTMTCRVNGGAPIRIELARYMPSAPMTIRGVGFFSAVPEAVRVDRHSWQFREPGREIDLSRKHTKTVHKRLTVSAK